MTGEPPFGALRPSPAQERARALAHQLPTNYAGRKLASLFLGLAGGRQKRAFDVEIFRGQKARLHPFDNICEKRVYLTPQLWDPQERAFLSQYIASLTSPDFFFADIGANVGLYTLFARGEAVLTGKAFRAICVEPDPEMRARLMQNVAFSDAQGEVTVLPFAATQTPARLRFSINRESRGMSHIAPDGEMEVEGRPLLSLLEGAPRIDAMKIDIEGHEHAALAAFFASAPRALWPRLLMMETSHEDNE
ncbi:MAG: FkbM family methyltransferase, partial [Amphiplicatus sp.]|nr:FkbM family methyltransferase [Amphiplicatus sp.]